MNAIVRPSRLASIALVFGLAQALCACFTTPIVVRSMSGADDMSMIHCAWRTPEDRIEIYFRAALGGEYHSQDYFLTLESEELEAAASVPGLDPEAEGRLVLPRSRLIQRSPPKELPDVQTCPRIPFEPWHPDRPMLLEPPPESSMHLAWRSTKDDPPLATVPLVIHACWREPGAEHCRAVAIGLEEDQSSHSLARWTSPITIPVAIVLDVCLSCLMLGGGGA